MTGLKENELIFSNHELYDCPLFSNAHQAYVQVRPYGKFRRVLRHLSDRKVLGFNSGLVWMFCTDLNWCDEYWIKLYIIEIYLLFMYGHGNKCFAHDNSFFFQFRSFFFQVLKLFNAYFEHSFEPWTLEPLEKSMTFRYDVVTGKYCVIR